MKVKFKKELFLKKLSRKLYWECQTENIKVEKVEELLKIIENELKNNLMMEIKKIKLAKITEHFALRFASSKIDGKNLKRLLKTAISIAENKNNIQIYLNQGFEIINSWKNRIEIKKDNFYIVIKIWEDEFPHIDFLSCGFSQERKREKNQFKKYGLKNFQKRKIIKESSPL